MHLREAITLNRERLPRYARLSGGASLPISRTLIRAERWALPLARFVDRRAAPFQAHGIAIARDEFVSMHDVPPFCDRLDPAPSLEDFRAAAGVRIALGIWNAARSGGFPAAEDRIRHELAALHTVPMFHCLLRHLLESAGRVVRLAPGHATRAAEQDLPSPAGLSRLMLRLHLLALGTAARLDARAAPLQARGIPILCQDVPPIPPVL